jgi:hypothetical protein
MTFVGFLVGLWVGSVFGFFIREILHTGSNQYAKAEGRVLQFRRSTGARHPRPDFEVYG